MSMALVMSTMPDVWRKVLIEHVPDQGQRCNACRNSSGETASWPCQTYRIAQEAKWVSEGNLPGTGPHGSVSPRATSEGGRSATTSSSWDNLGSSWDSPAGRSWEPTPPPDRSWDLERSPLDRGYASPSYEPSYEPSHGSSYGSSYDLGHDPLGGRSLGGPYDPPPDSGPVAGLGRHGGGRHAGPAEAAPFGSRMDAPYGASFGVDDQPRGW